MLYDQFRAMGTDVIMAADGIDLDQVKFGFSLTRALIAQGEKRFTRFTSTSELADLNRSAGEWFHASDDMFEVLAAAYQLADQTDGLFNPAILPALLHAGYDRSFELIAEREPVSVNDIEVEVMDFRKVALDERLKEVLLPPMMQVDLGGIAKGWLVEQAASQLAKFCYACAVSAGGDMFLVNTPQDKDNWEVGLENPLAPELDIASLRIPPGGLATSSIAKRKWYNHGQLQHHLIDPRTGEPAQTDWLSVTVWAETAVEAEVYAKAILLAGPDHADEQISKFNPIAYLAVDKLGNLIGSENSQEVFHA